MNGWRSRISLILIFVISSWIHAHATASLPNNPEALDLYHGSASAVDWLLLFSAPMLISGRLCDDIQASCIASVIINFAGFCAYMAYAPPDVYNHLIEGLSYVQYLRLLYVGRYDADYHERTVVPGTSCVRA